MPIAELDALDPRDFDAGGVSLGHAAGAQMPSGAGRSLAERLSAVTDKVNEVITDGINGLPLTSTKLATVSEKTIASGAITITTNLHTVDTEADAASDDLDTINGGSAGSIVFLYAANDARTVVLKHNTGNILCPYGQDVSLAEDDDLVMLVYNGTASKWVVVALKLTAAASGGLGAVLALTTAGNGAALVGIQDSAGLITATTVEAALAELVARLPTNVITDPGNGGAIPVTTSGSCAITTAGAGETRTLAIPSFKGQVLDLYINADGGGVAITVAQAINQAGNTVITMNDLRDFISLKAITVSGALRWQVIANDGAVLS